MRFVPRSPSDARSAFEPIWIVHVAVVLLFVSAFSGCSTIGLGLGGDPLSHDFVSSDIIGRIQTHRIRGDETLLDLTRRYELGYVELVAANPGIDPWVPGVGTRVVLPTAHVLPPARREGIVINLAEQRLYYFGKRSLEERSEASRGDAAKPNVLSFPIGVGRDGWATPLGRTRIVRKRKDPIWYPTRSARKEDPSLAVAVRAGPENPLGNRALYLGWPTYLIHGTNEPDGVGRRVSRGCIRLYPEGILRLFEATSVDTPVQVIDEPVKLGWVGSDVYLEVHPSLDDMGQIEEKGVLDRIRPPDLRPRIREFAGLASSRIDWSIAYRVAAERRGLPVRITR